MKIALIGYGKMGKIIEEVALAQGHEIMLCISSRNTQELTKENLSNADVAIEFTSPDAAPGNILTCLEAGIAVVSGTTGWGDRLEEARQAAIENKTAFIHATNFSIGVNLFFEINKMLAKLMDGREEYEVQIEETHHTQKKDAPSGTAITLAEQILEIVKRKKSWALGASDNGLLGIEANRTEGVPGTHIVRYTSAIDDIEITHTAHNRLGFARGAVAAAEFAVGKAGVYTMKDVLGISAI